MEAQNQPLSDRDVHISPDYCPSQDEPYMCARHLSFFKNKLRDWRNEILKDSVDTIHHMQEQTQNEADITDRASTETDRALELRTRDRGRKLINKIDDALRRIEDGTYGYCEETGEPIGLARLIARPVATLSIEAQERHEKEERIHSDD
tara:strand:- start:642 stop:1088 length:447 start_codon:yes stop_codon:yes gene_type:complete